jgi:hypothetical protein
MNHRRPLPPARIARLEAERLTRQAEIDRRRAKWTHYIYFLTCEGYVKIGYARDPMQRWAAAQVGNPFPIALAAIALGGKKEERILHRTFRDLHLRAEWFRLAPPLDEIVAKISDETPLAARIWLGEWLFSLNGSTALLIDEPHKTRHMDTRTTSNEMEIVLPEQHHG